MNPKRNWLRVGVQLERSEEWDRRLEEAGLDLMGYSKSGRYRLRLTADDLNQSRELLMELFKASYEQFGQ